MLDHITYLAAAVPAAAALYILYKQFTRISISHIPGPTSQSLLLGNLGELAQDEAVATEFKWQSHYGDVVRVKGPFGEDRLLLSDPKALQYVYQTSGYNFIQQLDRRELSRLIAGKGILWADRDDHKRHRKILLPGFSVPDAKRFVPLFTAKAAKITAMWKDVISSTDDFSSTFDLQYWASRAALDVIGEAAFDYHFGALDNAENELGKAYSNMMLDTFGAPTKAEIFFVNMLAYMPAWLREWIVDHVSGPKFDHVHSMADLSTRVARELVQAKSKALLEGKGSRDIMSLLVKANAAEGTDMKLNEEELLSQMRTLLLAGHETTSTTLTWTIFEIARNPECQTRLRSEIREMEKMISQRGDTEFTASDLEAMPYLTAVVKEGLRYHPTAINTFRLATQHDVLPLSKPIRTTTGEVIHRLPIPKGTKIIASIGGYNRNKDIFGEDAHVFNPDRWLNDSVKKSVSLGVIGNLLTFSAGTRACLGWKFAVLELQAFIAELIGQFQFSLTPESKRIRREAVLVMVPTVEGEVEKGVQMPLQVTVAPRDEQDDDY